MSGPSRSTLTLTGDMRTFRSVSARTFQATVGTVRPSRTGMFTRQTNVSGTTNNFTSDMIARLIAIHHIRTLFFAAMAIESFGTWFATRVARPAATAYTFAGLWVTRRIVQTEAFLFAVFTVQSRRTLGFTVYA